MGDRPKARRPGRGRAPVARGHLTDPGPAVRRRVPSRRAALLSGLALGALAAASGAAQAQSAWDSAISNTYWYVPTAELLAYAAPASSLKTPIPIGDQTLWALGTSTNGVFTGTSTAQFQIGPLLTSQVSAIQGSVLPSGQITMIFTPTSGGTTTVGLGVMQVVNGVTSMEMQMITGDSLLVTHWAYMLPYNPATFTPPAPQTIPVTLSSTQWTWTEGTPWKIVSPALFGGTTPGKIIITNYTNGYFWGKGLSPTGASFTLLGSITPEGKVLFASTDGSQLATQYGGIAGDALAAQMALESYNYATGAFSGLGSTLTLVSPYALTVAATDNPSALGAARSLYAAAGTDVGFTGALAPAVDALNALSGRALSGALSQTLPILAGQAAQATYGAQRAFQETVSARLEGLADPASERDARMGPEAARHAWITPFGVLAGQGRVDGYPGTSSSGGGVAAGIDWAASDRVTLGLAAGYSASSISDDALYTANTLDLSSYHFGAYGRFAMAGGTDLFFQLDGAVNDGSSSRLITFMGSSAGASPDSYTGHIGIGARQALYAEGPFKLAAALRLDYGRVNADGYSETGAGALDLTVGTQTYRELRLGGEVTAHYALTDHLKLTALAGLGYDFLNDRQQVIASFAGGGDPFVTYGADLSPWLYSAGIGLVGFRQDAFELGLTYRLDASPTGYLSQMSSIELKVRL
ncbi:autotransporter outer membrane beta-barrel domain-containing protein [Azorhizobium doebereinerae]|uniref:autotransporter family protein n=1 Tax=Azorhizobium doebereinerae TaxID=281091 RepID=UPI000687DF5A|nr:autotransporter outer membrane beta-barrel domain-containing protein [Azorhizobium doebereinerae]